METRLATGVGGALLFVKRAYIHVAVGVPMCFNRVDSAISGKPGGQRRKTGRKEGRKEGGAGWLRSRP